MRKIFIILLVAMTTLGLRAQSYSIHYLRTGVHQVLEHNALYRLPFDSLQLNMVNAVETSPLTVDSGNTAVIELRNGQVISVYGSKAKIQTTLPEKYYAAYPGIRIAKGATLVVFGQGEIIAQGGDAAQGLVGQNGGTGILNAVNYQAADGGAGGHGGHGSAPGIGGHAGLGGKGGATTKGISGASVYELEEDNLPIAGANGENGMNGEDMGTLIVIGNVRVHAQSGAGTEFETRYGVRGSHCTRAENGSVFAAYGGGGGNGGGADSAQYSIGGGAPGAGGGGAGCSGGIHAPFNILIHLVAYTGAGGKGGESADPELSGHHGEGIAECSDVKGGRGGLAGAHGDHGLIRRTSSAIIDGSYDAAHAELLSDLATLPELVRSMLSRKIVGADWVDGRHEIPLYYYSEMIPTQVKIPTDPSKGLCLGYVDQFGKQVYDQNGTLALDTADYSNNFYRDSIVGKWYVTTNDSIQLHPRWTGVRNIHVLRYIENVNWTGNSADPRRYTSSDRIYGDVFTVPALENDTTLTIPIYVDHHGRAVLDSTLYTYVDSTAMGSIVVSIAADDSIVCVPLYFDGKRFALTYSGLDEEMMSRQCTNLDDYTRPGSYPVGKVINLPSFRQLWGKELSHWQQRDTTGEYHPMESEAMPACDRVLLPVFRDVLFHTDIRQKGQGTIEAFVIEEGDTLSVDSVAGIRYHSTVLIRTTAAAKYIREKVSVIRVNSGEAVELEQTDSTVTFPMPDEDVVIAITYTYRPHQVLNVMKATENMLGAENIAYYVTKDRQTYYTNDSTYYHFPEEQWGGCVAEMEYGVGDKLVIHTDYMGDEESRESNLYIVRRLDGQNMLEEVRKGQSGSADSTFYFYLVEVDSLMMETDRPIEIIWSNPRTPYHIQATPGSRSYVSALYANGRDISGSAIAYKDNPIEFSVASADSVVDLNSIVLEYYDGYDQVLISGGCTSVGSGAFTFLMPESDVRISLVDSAQHQITAVSPRGGALLSAPNRAAAGYPVVCTIRYAEGEEIPEDEDIHIYVNGVDISTSSDLRCDRVVRSGMEMWMTDDSDSSSRFRTKTFIMPDSDVVITMEGVMSDIDTVEQTHGADTQIVYDLLGQKVAEMQNGRVVKGSMPMGIVIINGQKYLNQK